MVRRIVFVSISILAGYGMFAGASPLLAVTGAALGAVAAGAILWLEQTLQAVSFATTIGGALGLTVGALVAGILGWVGGFIFDSSAEAYHIGALVVVLTCGYLGMIMGARLGKEGLLSLAVKPLGPQDMHNNFKILDTSVIIDGRVADLCETGFLEGTFLVPQFILLELQQISDSSDSLKRARGRRGLDILNKIQKLVDVDVRIVEDDFPQVKEVDSKIVAFAKKIGAKVITNDLNLNKVAELQGVRVLNINELCNALKPVVLPGETIRVFVLKEGKEAGQGVAYLDDGTMIVVDNAKRCIGKNVDVVVTSVLQTNAGRMIFTRLKEETDKEELHLARG